MHLAISTYFLDVSKRKVILPLEDINILEIVIDFSPFKASRIF